MNSIAKLVGGAKSVKPIYMVIGVIVVVLVVVSLYNRDVIQGFVGSGSDSTFTLYYVDWCPHCKTIKPIFSDFMGSGTVNVNGQSVKCNMVNAEASPDATKGLNIKGYPTLLLNTQGNTVEFSGERTAEGFMNFLKQNVA